MNNHKSDDHIYGAARYLANSFGISLLDTDSIESIDPPLLPLRKNEVWRQAKFHCRCPAAFQRLYNIGIRAFCTSCSFIISYQPKYGTTKCKNCNTNEYWENPTVPCITCQLATIVYRTPSEKGWMNKLTTGSPPMILAPKVPSTYHLMLPPPPTRLSPNHIPLSLKTCSFYTTSPLSAAIKKYEIEDPLNRQSLCLKIYLCCKMTFKATTSTRKGPLIPKSHGAYIIWSPEQRPFST